MAWTNAKTAVAVGAAVLLAGGAATTSVIHQHSKARTDFPRSSWGFAGYVNPVSAFETTFWAVSRSDGKTILASLTPGLQQQLRQDLARMKQSRSPEEYLSQDRNSADRLKGVTGFRVLKSEAVSDGEVLLHLSVQGKPDELAFKMKKIGNEWKMDDFPSSF